MGIIDDYNGGYESLALFMDSDGEVDFEAAYEAQLDECDEGTDPFERAFQYKFNQELKKMLPGWKDTGRKTFHGKPIYEGLCSSCRQPCTVPFAPRLAGNPPMCKGCLGQSKTRFASGPRSEAPIIRTRVASEQHSRGPPQRMPECTLKADAEPFVPSSSKATATPVGSAESCQKLGEIADSQKP